MNTRQIEWYETEYITDMDNLVEEYENKHGVKLEPTYMDTFNAVHLADWKQVACKWLQELIDGLGVILEEVESLPDDTNSLYEVEAEEDEEEEE